MSKGIDLKERYKTYLRLERGLSPNSIDAYLTDVDKLFRFANEEGKPVTEITYDDLRQFIARLCDIGIHPRSQARILSGIKSFYGFLMLEEYITADPTELIESPKIGLRLPEVVVPADVSTPGTKSGRLDKTFFFGLFALFSYEVAEISINTFFINYVSDPGYVSPLHASFLLSFGGLSLFMAGRFGGSALMRRVAAERLLLVCALGALTCMALVVAEVGWLSVGALIVCYLFESIMFPTIFSMSLSGLHGRQTGTASSFLVMSIVGGAVSPVLMGFIGEARMSEGFLLPLVCFIAIAVYSVYFDRQLHMKKDNK